MTSRPAASATSALLGSIAGTMFEAIGLIPRTSKAIAIVLAVNWPPQAPTPGDAASSIAVRRSSSICPAA